MEPNEIVGNIWKIHMEDRTCDIVVPTNNTVKKNGLAVMGAGLAADAVRKYPSIEYLLGKKLKADGNCVHYFGGYRIITFPVKYEWFQMADYSLIKQSAHELKQLMDDEELSRVLVPRVGCGNGGLQWHDVKPILERELDSRCEFIRYNKEV